MLHFIVNPLSRSGKGLEIWNKIHGFLEETKVDYKVHFTKFHGHATEISNVISNSADAKHTATIVVLGGDGTLNEVVNGLSKTEYVTLGYIASGSGNDFSRSMKFPKNTMQALDIVLHPKAYKYIDYGIIKSDTSARKFIVSTGIGFDANIAHEVFSSKLKNILNKVKLGKFSYLLIGIKHLFLSKNAPASLIIDSNIHLDMKKMFFTSIHVQKYEGGGFPFAPDADPTDDKLEVCVFHDSSKWKYAFLLICSMFGKHGNFKGADVYSCKSVSLKSNIECAVHTDGENLGFQKNIAVTSSGEQIRFITG